MKRYIVQCNTDWGYAYSNKEVSASNWGSAFAKAGRIAKYHFRKRPKEVAIRIRLVGTIKKDSADHLGLPADTDTEDTPL